MLHMGDQNGHDEEGKARALWEEYDYYQKARVLYDDHRYSQALDSFRSLALTRSDDGPLLFHIATMYSDGLGTDRDLAEAERWTEKSAHAGFAKAQFYLAGALARQRQYEQARRWLQSAAAQGYSPAIYHLGRMYELGRWGPLDRNKARRYFEDAAARGHVWAQRQIAVGLLRGEFGLRRIPNGLMMLGRIFWTALRLRVTDPLNDRLVA